MLAFRAAGLTLAAAVVAWGCAFRTAPATPVLDRRDLRSVPELLGALPESLRSHFVLMTRSRSPEPASPEGPRVILYGEDARQVVAFDRFMDSVQMMTFDDASSTFAFREVTFPEVAGRPTMVVSEANPARCTSCHGVPARPVWDTYPVWPGALGESDLSPPNDDERSTLAAFERTRGAHPRYGLLLSRKLSEIERAEQKYQGRAELAATAELSGLFGALNARAVAAELRASPRFHHYRYALIAALSPECGDFERTLPQGDRGFLRGSYPEFAEVTRRADAEQETRKRARSKSAVHGRSTSGDRPLTRLRFVAERSLGIPTAGWTLALEKGTYDFTSSARQATGFERRLFEDLGKTDPRLMDLYWNASDRRLFCATLAERAREALDEAPTGSSLPRGAASLGLTERHHAGSTRQSRSRSVSMWRDDTDGRP
jgi:hypothetical protein